MEDQKAKMSIIERWESSIKINFVNDSEQPGEDDQAMANTTTGVETYREEMEALSIPSYTTNKQDKDQQQVEDDYSKVMEAHPMAKNRTTRTTRQNNITTSTGKQKEQGEDEHTTVNTRTNEKTEREESKAPPGPTITKCKTSREEQQSEQEQTTVIIVTNRSSKLD